MKNKRILIVGVCIVVFLTAFFYALFENPYKTVTIKVLDCEYTYRDYYFDDWKLRDSYIKPQPTTAFGKQFAEKEIGMCLYGKYFQTLHSQYKIELLKLFKNSEEVMITEKNFVIDKEFKNKTGLNKPKDSIDFNQYYLE
ncbi:hypothetical protein PFY10_00495 [Chryseobacterium daecheongense]|nr:hypothetical protein PFY10_00495 [Chryseobacterium daecheongense]